MNLWHDVPAGKDTPETFNMIIEVPKWSKNKYEVDKETGLIKLDRVAHTGQDYPFDYGFVPQTLWHDDDALDVILLTTYPLQPGILLDARPVGFMYMIDNGDEDHKVIAVPANDKRFEDVKDLGDINPHTIKEIENFHTTYKKIESKVVEVTGFDNVAKAKEAILESIKIYQDKFGKKN